MKKYVFHIAAAALAAVTLCSCGVSSKAGKGGAYTVTEYKEWTVTGVEDHCSNFSGIVKTFDGSRFIGAFNSAGLYYIEVPKDREKTLTCTPLWALNAQFSDGKRDIEGIAVDRVNGDIYFSQERETRSRRDLLYAGNTVYRLRYPDYAAVETVHSFDKLYFANNNYTIEGLTWVSDGQYLLGREGNPKKPKEYPAAIMKYSPKDGITGVTVVTDWTKQVAGMYYDPQTKLLWVLDGDYDKQIHVVKARNLKKVADIDIRFIENAEGICVDHERGCVWIASDEEPSKLYRLNIKGL